MIEKFDVNITPFQLKRTMHIYLPDDYYDSEERYPVMYMYDGHNLFNDDDATYGKSWGLSDFLDNYDKKFIIVGMECNHTGNERLNEYCPYNVEHESVGEINGRGEQLMDWVVDELKPFIDNIYRTHPSREYTGIGGSSMGGLMALYTIIKYNKYFSKAACLSPSIFLCMNELKNDLESSVIDQNSRVYFSFGTKEVRNMDLILDYIGYFDDYFAHYNASSYVYIAKNGKHNEATWEKQNKIYFDFLYGM